MYAYLSAVRSVLALTILTISFQAVRPSFTPAAEPKKKNEAAAKSIDPGSDSLEKRWRKSGWELMQQYCLDCHNDVFQEAELDLSGFKTVEGVMTEGNGMLAERVLNMVRFGAMPPEDYDVPSDEEREQLVEALDTAIYSVTCDLRPKPGKVTARRLNRAEYNHTIRDLFGIDLRLADRFPSDEVGAGFDNNGDVLSLSTMLIEKYMDAAEEVAENVIIDPATLPNLADEAAGDRLIVVGDHRTGSFFGRFLASDAFVWTEFDVPADGTYRVEVGLGVTEEDHGSGSFGLFDRSGKLLDRFEAEYYGGNGRSERSRTTVHLDKGKRFLAIAPLDEPKDWKEGKTVHEKIAAVSDQQIAEGRESLGKTLNVSRRFDGEAFPYMVRKIEIHGPKDFDDPVYPPSQWQIVKAQPDKRRDRYVGVKQAAAKCLKPLMRRAFRQPVTDQEVEPYAKLVEEATDRDESYHRGLQIAVSAVLVSPRFLFRVETPPEESIEQATREAEDDDSDVVEIPLTPHQLASRLSYFLWSSTPDERLLKLAEQGKLVDEKVLTAEVRRMIADEKAHSLATEFAAQWLGLRNLEIAEPDPDRFQEFKPSLLPKMAEETERLFMHLVRENRPTTELLTADYTFVDDELASFYGLPIDGSDQFRRVSLSGTPRRGVLSHASVLTLTSNPTRTSPVKRGKWILENIMGTPPPEPPAGVPELEDADTADADASLREQLELHRADPSCAACHRVMDQLGFGLEQFDAVGQYREMDGKFPVDASGELPGGREFVGAQQLTKVLGQSEREAFANTVAQRLLTYALGRELTPADRCTTEEIVAAAADDDYRMTELITRVVLSRPFRYYEWQTFPSSTGASR